MAVSLSMSKALMSIVTGLFMVNWLIEGQFATKMRRLKERKSLMLIISVFLLYLFGLLWTDSLNSGLQDVKIQLPFLIIPLVIGTSEALNYIQVKRIIYMFSAAVIVASLCSIFVLFGFSGKSIQDPREMSLFISHIRFSLLINISIFSLFWFARKEAQKSILEKTFLFLAIIWLTIFLVILKSATGWGCFSDCIVSRYFSKCTFNQKCGWSCFALRVFCFQSSFYLQSTSRMWSGSFTQSKRYRLIFFRRKRAREISICMT